MPQLSKKSKIITAVVGGALTLALIAGGVFIVNANHYEDRFLPNTYIQEVDVSGMELPEAIDAVSNHFAVSTVTIQEDGRDDISITSEEIGMSPVQGEIDDILAKQDKWNWLAATFGGKDEHAIGVKYDVEKLGEIVDSFGFDADETRVDATDSSIAYDEEAGEFRATESKAGTQVDVSALTSEVSQLIANGGGIIDISEFYVQPQYTEQSEEVLVAEEAANKVIGKTIKYNIDGIDDAETLTKEQIVSFVKLGDDMTLSVDENAVAAWLREMGEKYDTVGKPKTYTTVYGKEVELPGGTYGWITDEAGMLPIVKENILSNAIQIDQDFVYQQEAAAPAGNGEWGDTYIDVDITDQMVRIVQEGELTHEFVCITGKPDGKHDSTQGEHQVVRMEKDFVMTGELNSAGVPEYRTPCDFFVAWASNGCAFHDAIWQPWERWNKLMYRQGWGSHGCANMRPADAATLYEIAYMGMPVLVHE